MSKKENFKNKRFKNNKFKNKEDNNNPRDQKKGFYGKINETMKSAKENERRLQEVKEELVSLRQEMSLKLKEKEVARRDVYEMTFEEGMEYLDSLVDDDIFSELEIREEQETTVFTDAWNSTNFNMFCSAIWKEVYNDTPPACRVGETDFVALCDVSLQLMLLSQPEVVGHNGITAAEQQAATSILKQIMIPEVIYKAMNMYKPVVVQETKTRVVLLPYSYHDQNNARIAFTAALAYVQNPGNGQNRRHFYLTDPVCEVVDAAGNAVANVGALQAADFIRHSVWSRYLTELIETNVPRGQSVVLYPNDMNDFMGVDCYTSSTTYYGLMLRYRGQNIPAGLYGFYGIMVDVSTEVQKHTRIKGWVYNFAIKDGKSSRLRRNLGHYVFANGTVSVMDRGIQHRFFPWFWNDARGHENSLDVSVTAGTGDAHRLIAQSVGWQVGALRIADIFTIFRSIAYGDGAQATRLEVCQYRD